MGMFERLSVTMVGQRKDNKSGFLPNARLISDRVAVLRQSTAKNKICNCLTVIAG